MSGIRAGNIYYTVGIDKASLAALKREVKAIGDTAKGSSQGLASINPELAKLAAQSTDVSNRMRILNNDFKGNRRESQEFKDGMRALGVEAGRLRDEVAALGPDIINSDRAMALASGTTSKLSGVMTQAAKTTGNMGTSSQMLGTEVVELMRYIDAINTEIRTLADELSVGAITTNQFSASMEKQKGALASARTQFERMNTSVDKTDGSTKQLRDTQRKLSITTRLMSNETAKATGRINQMAMAKKLSYGATTLLNDRIFQMSPALGILTNQLIFTTNGFKAFIRAAAPIVAVAGAIIGAISSIVISIKSGIGLEQALADVRKTTNLTNMELRALTNTFQDVAKRLPSTTLELLEIARVAGQLGITGAANIEKFTVAVAELSIATDVAGEEGATSLARFLQATGTATEQLGDIAGQVGNILNELENTTAATASEILRMTSYTQGLASQAGATRPEILGLNAALLSLGVKAEAGGSAVVRTISKMQVAAVQGGDSFQRFADVARLSVEEFQQIVDDSPVEALLALARGMRASADEGANLNQVLIDLGINEVRERRALLALAQGAETFADAMDTANTEALEMLSLQAEVEIMSGTVGAKLTMLKSRFSTLFQEMSNKTLPVFGKLVDILITTVDGLTFFIKNVNLGIGALQELAGAPADVSKELGTLTGAFTRTREDIETVKGAIVDMSEATGKNGLIGVLQDFAAALDTDGRNALARFVDATVEPLLSQGKLQEAISETIGWFVKMGAAASRESLSAMTSLYNLTYARLEQASAEYNSLMEMRQRLLEGPQTQGTRAAIEDITLRLIQIDTDNEGLAALREQFNREGREVIRLQEEVEFYENAVEELSQMTSVEDMRAWIAENFGAGRTRITDDVDPDGAGSGVGGKSPLEEIMRRYREESNFLIAMMEDQGSTIEAQRVQAQGALENAQRTKEALYRLLSSEDLDPTLVSGIFDAISDMDRVISDLGVVDPLASAVAWVERLAAEVRFGFRSAQSAIDLISPRLAELEEEAATALDEFGISSTQYQDALNKIDILKAALGDIEPPAWFDPQADRRAMDTERRRSRQFAVTGPTLAEMHDILGRKEYLQTLVDEYEERQRINELLKEAAMLSDQERRASLGAAAAARAEQDESLARAQLGMQEDRRRMAGARIVADYNEELRLAKEFAEALIVSSTAIGAAMDRRAARGFTVDDEAAQADWGSGVTPAIQAVQQEVALLTRYLADGEGPGPMLLAAFRELQALAPEVASGFNELARELLANELAAKLVVDGMAEIRNEEDELQAQWPGSPPPPREEPKTTISSGQGELTRVGFDKSLFDNVKAAFLNVAQSSDVVGSALASMAMETDDSGKIIGMSFDPMMMLVQVIGKVLSKSEGFATALETLDKVLDPLVDIVDMLFTALQPIIEVAVALVQSALKPFVWIVENVLAPVLTALANIVRAVWNALASFLFWLEKIEEDEPEDDSGTPPGSMPGSIKWAREGLANAQRMYEEATTQAMREALKGVIEFWEEVVDRIEGVETPQFGSLAYMRDELSKLREQYEWATSDEERQLLLEQIRLLEEQIEATEAIAEGRDPDKQVQAGANISEITGPTRDLLIDLLTPLSILPSWTSMIQDIRNDVRSIAMANYGMATPSLSTASINTQSVAAAGTNYTFQNVTITTNATSVQDLVRDISKFTYKERRGGK